MMCLVCLYISCLLRYVYARLLYRIHHHVLVAYIRVILCHALVSPLLTFPQL